MRGVSLKATILSGLAICGFAIDSSPFADEQPPSVPVDRIVLKAADASGRRQWQGAIEDITGNSIVLRRGNNGIEVISWNDVRTLDYRRSPSFVFGLDQLKRREFESALRSFESAEVEQQRPWALREVRAIKARALNALGRFDDCLATVEMIVKSDSKTRHLIDLPLVWDERLPKPARFAATVADLDHVSDLKKLVAASVLLDSPDHMEAAIRALTELRLQPNEHLQRLSKVQLWRNRLAVGAALTPIELDGWQLDARTFDRRLRAIAEFLIGRAYLKNGDFESAVDHLLWMPLVEPFDPSTTGLAVGDAVQALNTTGRHQEAQRLSREFELRMKNEAQR